VCPWRLNSLCRLGEKAAWKHHGHRRGSGGFTVAIAQAQAGHNEELVPRKGKGPLPKA
jgi:hypothetical protein